jgi:hypothetical protein
MPEAPKYINPPPGDLIPRLILADLYDAHPRIEPKSVALAFCDFPWGVLKLDWDKRPQKWLLIEEILDTVLKENGVVVLRASFEFSNFLIEKLSNRFAYKHYYVLVKAGMVVNDFNPISSTEFLIVLRKKSCPVKDLVFNKFESGIIGPVYRKKNYQRSMSTRAGIKGKENNGHPEGKRMVRSNLECRSKSNMCIDERTSHPCQLDTIPIMTILNVHTIPGDLVFDPTFGSGSVLESSYRIGRRSIGIEINPLYHAEAVKRIARITTGTTPAAFQADLFTGDIR